MYFYSIIKNYILLNYQKDNEQINKLLRFKNSSNYFRKNFFLLCIICFTIRSNELNEFNCLKKFLQMDECDGGKKKRSIVLKY